MTECGGSLPSTTPPVCVLRGEKETCHPRVHLVSMSSCGVISFNIPSGWGIAVGVAGCRAGCGRVWLGGAVRGVLRLAVHWVRVGMGGGMRCEVWSIHGRGGCIDLAAGCLFGVREA